MIGFKVWSSLDKDENATRVALLRDWHQKEYECIKKQREFLKYKKLLKEVEGWLAFTKAFVNTKPIDLFKVPQWSLPTSITSEVDFNTRQKAYAYHLYYKEHYKLLVKQVTKLKKEVKELQRRKDIAYKSVDVFDKAAAEKYIKSVEVEK